MAEKRTVKSGYRENVEGNKGRRRMQRRWKDEVQKLLMGIGLKKKEG